MGSYQKILFTFLFLCSLNTVTADYCLCEDIMTESICVDSTTYNGISFAASVGMCHWHDGTCMESDCAERRNAAACESDYGFYYCGWVNGAQCITPTQCSDISTQRWCVTAGCFWAKGGSPNQGLCSGTLGGYGCENLNAAACKEIGTFFDFKSFTWDVCYLTASGQCASYRTCNLFSSQYECDPVHCKWNPTNMECQVKQCMDMATQSECSKVSGDDETVFICQWKDSDGCVPAECEDIKDQTLCQAQNEGYGTYCTWTNNKCQTQTCSSATDKDTCLHATLVDGGFSTCTWANTPSGNSQACYGCFDGPLYTSASIITLAALSLIMFGFLV